MKIETLLRGADVRFNGDNTTVRSLSLRLGFKEGPGRPSDYYLWPGPLGAAIRGETMIPYIVHM